MIIRSLLKSELTQADEFQQRILNPKNKKRYRSFSYIKKSYSKNPKLFIGAFDGDKLVGIIFSYVKRKNVLLGEMAIEEEYRGKGLGSKILDFFEREVAKLRKRKIILGARESAEKFYLKKGYKPILLLQIKYSNVPKNYRLLTKHEIIKETNYSDAKRLFVEVKTISNPFKKRLSKIFHAYDAIYLFEKTLE